MRPPGATSPDILAVAHYADSPARKLHKLQATHEATTISESAREVREIENIMQRHAENARLRRVRKEYGTLFNV